MTPDQLDELEARIVKLKMYAYNTPTRRRIALRDMVRDTEAELQGAFNEMSSSRGSKWSLEETGRISEITGRLVLLLAEQRKADDE